VKSVDKALEDKKVTLFEWVVIAKNFVGIWDIVKNYQETVEELKDITEAEKDELVKHFEVEFDLVNDEAEALVESVISIIIGLIVVSRVN
jgi:hypothetical protein